LERL
jgi:Zn-dependent protease